MSDVVLGQANDGGEIVAEADPSAPKVDPEVRAAHLKAAEGAVLRADNLIAGYVPGVNILNGADLSCSEGELVGIIGPNGAGKSTRLKALFGLVRVGTDPVPRRGGDVPKEPADPRSTTGTAWAPRTKAWYPSRT